MKRALFRPSAMQIAVLAGSTACALGFAMAMRYLAIENTPLGLTCDAGAATVICGLRRGVLVFSQAKAFGYVALAVAILNFARPSIALAWLGLVLASLGLVLYNTSPSAVAVALLALSLGRPVPEPE